MIIDTHVHVWDLDKAEYPWLEGDSSILNQTGRLNSWKKKEKKQGLQPECWCRQQETWRIRITWFRLLTKQNG